MTNAAIVARTRVLLVEDAPEARAAHGNALGRAGYDVVAAGTIDEACRSAYRWRPDLVILACRLPDGSGIDLFHRWRGTALMAKVPVILLSRLSEAFDAQAAAHAGADAVVLEPCSGEMLARSLGRVLLGTGVTPKPARYRMTVREPSVLDRCESERSVPTLHQHEGVFHARCEQCLRGSPLLGRDAEEAEKGARDLGWAPRSEGWECPICIERYKTPPIRPKRKTEPFLSGLGAHRSAPASCRGDR